MLKKTCIEIALIVLFSAAVGIGWNHTLLRNAWRGESVGAAQAQQKGDDLPMPVGIMQAKEMSDAKEAILVDARDAASFASGHLKGALSLPLGEAMSSRGGLLGGKIPLGTTIITYCNGFSCHDGMELGKLLMKAGYRSVYVYEGGFPEWRDAGYPMETGAQQ